jgi:hypothetical protein
VNKPRTRNLTEPSTASTLRKSCLLLLLLIMAAAVTPSQAAGDNPDRESTLLLADPADAYYALAQEIAEKEGLPLVHTLPEVLARDAVFLLWIVSPGHLSDEALVDFALATRDRPSAISAGIITGTTLDGARALWLRASDVRGDRVFAANAENPAGHIPAGILVFDGPETSVQALTLANLVGRLQEADYLTFTGHGGTGFLVLDADTELRPGRIPPLPPAVIATGSCNTFRPWEDGSIALAFVDRGAAAYAGFAYSPNAGYLIGAYRGLPFRYTWPGYPIGHAVQVQNHGTLQGFAQIPFYFLLGDPRIALQAEPAYRQVEAQTSAGTLTISYAGAPAGVIPVRIPGGARFTFVEASGAGAAWEHEPFYNSRLQMTDIGSDKFVLFEHKGGDFELQLRSRPPWYWVPADILVDALDGTLLFLQEGGGDLLLLIAGLLAVVPVAVLLLRKRAPIRWLVPACLTGLGFSAAHGLYALARLDRLTITSKTVILHPLGFIATFLVVSCAAFLYLSARSWRGKAVAILVASLGALEPAIVYLVVLPLANALVVRPRLGAGLWNFAPGWQGLVVLVFEWVLFGLVFWIVSKVVVRSTYARTGPSMEAAKLAEKEIEIA